MALNAVPMFPLHKAENSWLPAVYRTGEMRNVDLKTALLEAHLIQKIELGSTVPTHSVYRLLLTLIYSALAEAEEFPETKTAFTRWQLATLGGEPLPADAVESYFDKFEDRFYLVHDVAPFAQDPSLRRMLVPGGDGTEKEFVKAAKSATGASAVSALHPADPAYPTSGSAAPWGLTPLRFDPDAMSEAQQTLALFETLMSQRWNHGPILRGERRFFGDGELGKGAGDAHLTTAPLRRVVHFLPSAGSLSADLAIAMKFCDEAFMYPPEGREGLAYIAEWERPVDETTGWLVGFGRNESRALWCKAGAPRSAFNDSQAALLIIAEEGRVTALVRRLRWRNKAVKAEFAARRDAIEAFKERQKEAAKDEKRSPDDDLGESLLQPPFVEAAWNPYIAPNRKRYERPLNGGRNISADTAMSMSDLVELPLLGSSSAQYERPEWFDIFQNPSFRALFEAGLDVDVRVLVNVGKIDQDKEFADFSLSFPTRHAFDTDEAKGSAREWLRLGRGLAFDLKKASGSSTAEHIFWPAYTELFYQYVVSPSEVAAPSAARSEIRGVLFSVFESCMVAERSERPLDYAKKLGMLRQSFDKRMNE